MWIGRGDVWQQRLGAARAHRYRGDRAGIADLLHTQPDQIGVDRGRVDLAQLHRTVTRFELGDPFEHRGGILVAGPEPFHMECTQTAEAVHLDGHPG